MNNTYLEVISLVERLHRHFLEVVKLELEGLGIHDINNVQGMMLFNIGDAEMTVGELTLRGCYLGSNVSYNVKKMVENGYLVQQRSLHDRRSVHVRLTEKGFKLRDRLTAMHRRHAEMLPQALVGADDLQAVWRHPAPARTLLDPRRRHDAAAAAIRRLIFSGDRGGANCEFCADKVVEEQHDSRAYSAGARAERCRPARSRRHRRAGARRACARSSTTGPTAKTRGSCRRPRRRQLAAAHGIAYHHIPITAATLTRADVDAFAATLRDAAEPVVAHCRSGTRSTLLWALTRMREGADPLGADRRCGAPRHRHRRAAGSRRPAAIASASAPYPAGGTPGICRRCSRISCK